MRSPFKNTWLLVLPTDSIQGSEHIVKSFAKHLKKIGFNCKVIILSRKTSHGWQDLEESIDVTYFKFSNYFFGAIWLLFYLAFKNTHKVSYTFSSQTIINGTLGLAKRIGLIRAKVIVRESNSIFELLKGTKLKIYSIFYKLGYKGTSLVITQTDYMRNQLIKSLPSLSNHLNIVTIPNPFDFSDIESRKGDVDSKFQNKKYLIAAGRLAPAKGFDLLINAFKTISTSDSEIELIILGEGADREKLSEQIKELNLEERIHLPGYVSNVYRYFEKAKVCVLSSRIEGFPNVLLQMMSQNTSIVATLSAGGIDEIPHLFTCKPGDEHALKNQIMNALKSDTKTNREVFDNFLQSRTWATFFNQIENNLT
ncbi:MAG: hypothetical protein CML04_11480 [Pseudozobellia sp.]|nr:hypothetical protein [Pseudozobellia sp.]MBG50379.1 hypothetical protein [Pseudozobellia sp.]